MIKERIIIFGGFGFVGKNIIEKLYLDYDIHVIDKNIDLEFINIYKNIKYTQYDFLKDENISDIIDFINPEYVINLISLVSAERKIEIFDLLYQLNTAVVLKLFEVFKGKENLKLFIHFGSGEEYGNIASPHKESMREDPNSPYALIKQLTTNTVMMLNKNYGFPSMVIRPSNLFGIHQPENKFIPYIITKLKSGEPVEMTEGLQKRDYIYIDDFTELVNKIIKNNFKFIGRIINVGSGKSYLLRDIVEYIKSKTKSDSIIDFGKIPYRENEIMDFCLSINELEYLLSENLDTDLYENLDKYIKIMEEKK